MSLQVPLFGTTFQNPVLLAAGTCGFGREVSSVIDLESLGGLVTKSVTLEPRWGNPAPRVTELPAGMLNSVGLANPGVAVVRREYLPWLRSNLERALVFVSLAGRTPEEYPRLVTELDDAEGFLGFELNLSCPNDQERDGAPFALDPRAVSGVVALCRRVTDRPLLVKLAPNDPERASTVQAATEAGADALTLVNTFPGLGLDAESTHAMLGAGGGGVSGPVLRPIGVRAVSEARAMTDLPLIGVGGILTADDALQYLAAGASLIQVGTASFARPRAAENIARQLDDARRRLEAGSQSLLSPSGVEQAPREPGDGVSEAGPASSGRREGPHEAVSLGGGAG